MAVTGWSYGGYMTTWMIGHYQGWKAAVAGAAVTDFEDAYSLSDLNVTYGNGDTLQEAGNDLLARLFDLATGVHSGRSRFTSALGRPDLQVLTFLWELGETVARGGDIRPRVLGTPAQRPPLD
jgi:hypothetical protein